MHTTSLDNWPSAPWSSSGMLLQDRHSPGDDRSLQGATHQNLVLSSPSNQFLKLHFRHHHKHGQYKAIKRACPLPWNNTHRRFCPRRSHLALLRWLISLAMSAWIGLSGLAYNVHNSILRCCLSRVSLALASQLYFSSCLL